MISSRSATTWCRASPAASARSLPGETPPPATTRSSAGSPGSARTSTSRSTPGNQASSCSMPTRPRRRPGSKRIVRPRRWSRARLAADSHAYFRSPDHAPPPAQNLFDIGLDLKAGHSLVLASPSLSLEYRRRWEWIGPVVTPALLPTIDPALIRREPIRKPFPAPAGRLARPPPGGRIRDVTRWIMAVESVQGQGGSNACFKVACRLARHLRLGRGLAMAVSVESHEGAPAVVGGRARPQAPRCLPPRWRERPRRTPMKVTRIEGPRGPLPHLVPSTWWRR